MIYDRHS